MVAQRSKTSLPSGALAVGATSTRSLREPAASMSTRSTSSAQGRNSPEPSSPSVRPPSAGTRLLDGPGVAGVEQLRQVALTELLLRVGDLPVHRFPVHRPRHLAEDPDGCGANRLLGQVSEGECQGRLWAV